MSNENTTTNNNNNNHQSSWSPISSIKHKFNSFSDDQRLERLKECGHIQEALNECQRISALVEQQRNKILLENGDGQRASTSTSTSRGWRSKIWKKNPKQNHDITNLIILSSPWHSWLSTFILPHPPTKLMNWLARRSCKCRTCSWGIFCGAFSNMTGSTSTNTRIPKFDAKRRLTAYDPASLSYPFIRMHSHPLYEKILNWISHPPSNGENTI